MVVFDSLALSYVYIFLHSFISPETSASDIINGHGRCVCENSYHRTSGHSWSARESWESADRPDNVSLCNWCLTLILQIPEDTRRDIQINNQKKKKKKMAIHHVLGHCDQHMHCTFRVASSLLFGSTSTNKGVSYCNNTVELVYVSWCQRKNNGCVVSTVALTFRQIIHITVDCSGAHTKDDPDDLS